MYLYLTLLLIVTGLTTAASESVQTTDLTWAKNQLSLEVDYQLKKLASKNPTKITTPTKNSKKCEIEAKKLDDIINLQSNSVGKFQGTHLDDVSKIISALPPKSTSCVVRSLLTKTNRSTLVDKHEPLHLLQYMRQINLRAYDVEPVKLMHALRFLEVAQYPETLRILWQLKELSPFYVKAYNQVQTIYAKTQRGQGSVALRQNP